MDIALFTRVAGLAAISVVALQQILKLKIVPIAFANRYPVPTLLVLSIVASIIAVMQTPLQANAWTDWVLLVGTIAVVSAITYNQTLRNWAQLRAMEGEK